MRCSSDRAGVGRRSHWRHLATTLAGSGWALALVLALLGAGNGCSPKSPPEEERAPLTERERDSTLGATGLPGASAVTKALAVSDTAAARAAGALPETP